VSLPDPASVSTLLLDAGGVLVKPSFARVAEALRERGVAAEPAALAAAEARAKKALDRPPSSGPSTDQERGWHYCPRVGSLAELAGHLDQPGGARRISARLPPAR
jgi:hypothetical protein